jgi:hypothetical protein
MSLSPLGPHTQEGIIPSCSALGDIMSARGPLAAGSSTPMQSRRMKVRVLAGLLSAVLTPLLLTACHSGDSTGPNDTSLSWLSVSSGTTSNLYGVWGSSASDVWAVGDSVILHYNGANWSVSGVAAVQVATGDNINGQLRILLSQVTRQVRQNRGCATRVIEVLGKDTKSHCVDNPAVQPAQHRTQPGSGSWTGWWPRCGCSD